MTQSLELKFCKIALLFLCQFLSIEEILWEREKKTHNSSIRLHIKCYLITLMGSLKFWKCFKIFYQILKRLQDSSTLDFSSLQGSTPDFSNINSSTVIFSTMNYSTMNSSTMNYLTMNFPTVRFSTMNYSTVNFSAMNSSTMNFSTMNISKHGVEMPSTYFAGHLKLKLQPWTFQPKTYGCEVYV